MLSVMPVMTRRQRQGVTQQAPDSLALSGIIACPQPTAQSALAACYFKFAITRFTRPLMPGQAGPPLSAPLAPSDGTTNTEDLAWLLTLQDTMVAPCRLMVQVVLLPLSMGTTGTWPAIFVIPPFQKHFLLHSTRVPSSSQTGQLRLRQRPARVGLSQL